MDTSHIKVLAINGSARKGGNTAILLRYVMNELELEGIETEFIELSGLKIHRCVTCRKCWANRDGRCAESDDMGNVLIEKMAQADGILFGSPTYLADVSPEIKSLMDRACEVAKANDGMFRHKVGAAVVSVRRAGAIHTFDALNHFFLINEMIVPGSTYWNHRHRTRDRRCGNGCGRHCDHEDAGQEHGLAAGEPEEPDGDSGVGRDRFSIASGGSRRWRASTTSTPSVRRGAHQSRGAAGVPCTPGQVHCIETTTSAASSGATGNMAPRPNLV